MHKKREHVSVNIYQIFISLSLSFFYSECKSNELEIRMKSRISKLCVQCLLGKHKDLLMSLIDLWCSPFKKNIVRINYGNCNKCWVTVTNVARNNVKVNRRTSRKSACNHADFHLTPIQRQAICTYRILLRFIALPYTVYVHNWQTSVSIRSGDTDTHIHAINLRCLTL